jgi:molybdenum cofactor cytidylyltransferase
MNSKLSIIVLAAGRSRRMGQPKSLLPLGQRTVLQQVLCALAAAEPDQTLVVLGPTGGPVADSLAGYPVTLVWNRLAESEMSDSLQMALSHLPPDDDDRGVMVCLGDQPLITSQTYRQLVREHRLQPDRIHQPQTDGRTGHPVLLPQRLFREMAFRPTLRELLLAHREKRQLVDVDDPGILLDIDTPADYESLHKCWVEK